MPKTKFHRKAARIAVTVTEKTVVSEYGDTEIQVPHDRAGEHVDRLY